MQSCWLALGRQRPDTFGDSLDRLPRSAVYNVDKGEQAFFGIERRPVVRRLVGYLERTDAKWPLAAKAVRASRVHAREAAAELFGAVCAEAAFVDPLDRQHVLAHAQDPRNVDRLRLR